LVEKRGAGKGGSRKSDRLVGVDGDLAPHDPKLVEYAAGVLTEMAVLRRDVDELAH